MHTPQEAAQDLEIVEFWREAALDRLGRRIFQASDELYVTAGQEVPPTSFYEGFEQHENGIGMIRAFYDELDRLEHGSTSSSPIVTGEWRSMPAAPAEGYRAQRHKARNPHAESGPLVVLTGAYGYTVLEAVRHRLEGLANREIRLLEVPNVFFGGNTAVAGLMVGEDIIETIKNDTGPVGAYVIPDVALSGGVFIDDISLASVASAANAPMVVAPATAAGLLGAAR